MYASSALLTSVAPAAIAPPPAAIPVALRAAALIDAPPARFPAPRLIANNPDFPNSPVPAAAEPRNEPIRDVPVAAFVPNNPLPILAAPLPMLMNGVAILLSITAEKIEDKSGASPPGNNLPAFESRLPNPCHNFSDIASKSNPSEKPFAKDAPMLTPSSRVSPMSIPNMAMTPTFKPVPIPAPMSCAKSANFAFPVLFHHSENGSAINSSQAILTFPKKSASCHSFVSAIALNFLCILSILVSSQSINSSNPCSTAGICAVSQSARPLTYGDNLSPKDIFTPSTALCSRVMEPCRLSSMVSDIFAAAPSALLIASASLL